jgi:hypothetical protein
MGTCAPLCQTSKHLVGGVPASHTRAMHKHPADPEQRLRRLREDSHSLAVTVCGWPRPELRLVHSVPELRLVHSVERPNRPSRRRARLRLA